MPPGGPAVDWTRWRAGGRRVTVLPLELAEDASVAGALDWRPEAIVHLAAVASVREARQDPGARVGGQRRRHRPPGRGGGGAAGGRRGRSAAAARLDRRGVRRRRRRAAGVETDPAAAGLALRREQGRRRGGGARGLAPDRPAGGHRPAVSPHRAGPDAAVRRARRSSARLRAARGVRRARRCRPATSTPVRDLLDVRDVVARLPGCCSSAARRARSYNVAQRRRASRWPRCSARLAGADRRRGRSRVPDPALVRRADIPHLVGDSTKLRRATGWAPAISLEQTLRNWSMPKRTDLKTILLIGSGPIVIGQGAEFDYSGTQAVARAQGGGYEVILVNSNPATIMTDPGARRPDLHRAGDAGVGGQGDRARAAGRAAADDGRTDGAQRRDGAAARRRRSRSTASS